MPLSIVFSNMRVMTARRAARFCGALVWLAYAMTAQAYPGVLDPSFGTSGVVQISVAAPTHRTDQLKASVQQADGKLVFVGESDTGSNYDAVLLRLNPDGTPDASFGDNGLVVTPFGGETDQLQAVIQQWDGKLVVAGQRYSLGAADVALARYWPDGQLDTSFGVNGISVHSVHAGHDYATGLVQQADGKLVVGGYTHNGTNNDFMLLRLHSDGSLDTGFGNQGVVVRDLAGAADQATALLQQADGKLVLAGYTGQGRYDVALARFLSDGTPDAGFGTAGVVMTPVGPASDFAYALCQQADGTLMVGGYAHSGSGFDVTLLRYTQNGQLDADFGTGGIVMHPVGLNQDYAYALAGLADGGWLLAGQAYTGASVDIALVRLDAEGNLDARFGTGGIVTTDIGGGTDRAFSLLIQQDGHVVVSGVGTTPAGMDFVVARYWPDGAVDGSFADQGVYLAPGPLFSQDAAADVVEQPDGKLVAAGYATFNRGSGANQDIVLVRYLPDGSLDPTFGEGGVVATPIGTAADQATALVILPDGKLAVAGYSYVGGSYDFAVARYLPDGRLDTAFGNAGTVTLGNPGGHDFAYQLAVQANGQLVLAGTSSEASGTAFTLARLTAEGAPDVLFGQGGWLVTLLDSTRAGATSVQAQPDGALVAAGYRMADSYSQLALVRYHPSGLLDTAFGAPGLGGGIQLIDAPQSRYAVSLIRQQDGRYLAAGYTTGPEQIMLARFLDEITNTAPVIDAVTVVRDGQPQGKVKDGRVLRISRYFEPISLHAEVIDPDVGDSHQFQWTLNGQPHVETGASLTLDPAFYPQDTYTITV